MPVLLAPTAWPMRLPESDLPAREYFKNSRVLTGGAYLSFDAGVGARG